MKKLKKELTRNARKVMSGICLIVAVSLLISCNKDDGPTRTDLLVGTWTLDEINGDRVRSSLTIEITIKANGDYEEEVDDDQDETFLRNTGNWEWDRNETEIVIEYDQDLDDWELEVESLTANELEVDDGDDTYLLTKN